MAFKPIEILINAKDNASSVFTSLQGKVAAVGAAIATYFGISAFAGMVKGAADFEQGMSRVQAATGASTEEFEALKKAAEDVGAAGAYSSVEAAGALENLAKAGLNATEAIEALPAVLNLAQAGDVGLAESAEYVTKAVAGMGLAFTDAARVADVLALGANATNTSVAGLAQALSYAAPAAQSAGMSLESTVAILGKLADAGIDASRSGTALSGILAQFSDPASAFRRELAAAGITTTNFEQALHQLGASGPAAEKAIIAVGLNAGPALRSLLNQGMGALDDLTARLNNAQGSAAAAAAVMRDNLNSSMGALGKTWEYVTNTLATPVLPVLKDGVDQLAGAFRNAVADGTVGKFGEAIATAFQAGIKWVREFLGTVDFAAVTTRLQGFAASTGEVFTKVGEYATNAGNIVKLAYGTMAAGVNGVLTAIYGIGSVFAEVASTVMSGVAKLREGLAAVTFGGLSESFKLAAEDARSMAEGFGDAAQAMRDKASQSLGDMASRAQMAREGFAGLAGAVQQVAPVVNTASKAIEDMARQIEAAGKKTAELKAKTDEKAKADEAARAQLALLRKEYSDLVAGGSIQAAAEKLQEINRVMAAAPDAAGKAQAAIEQVEAAYRNLGMKTTKELDDAATAAQRSWDVIAASGTRSADALRTAFAAYANATIEAAQRQGDAAVAAAQRMLAAQAAPKGLSVETTKSGDVIVRAMGDAKKAVDSVRDATKGAAGGFQGMGQSAAQAAENVKKLNAIYDRHRLDGDASRDAIEKSRANVSGNASINQEDINQQIAARYGEAAIDNDLAQRAWQLRLQLENYRKNYGNVGRSKQSLLEQRNIAAELERVERLLDDELRGGGSGGGGRTASAPTTSTSSGGSSAPASGSGASGGGAPRGAVGGSVSVVNITMTDGRRRTVNTDSAGAEVIRELLEAKARS